MHILHVASPRSNLLAVAPVFAALAGRCTRQTLVNTGNRSEVNPADPVVREMRIPQPDENLCGEDGSDASQAAQILLGMERCLRERAPDLVLVYGDATSSMAATLAASQLRVSVGHVDAGLRSREPSAPEEVNRLVTDRLAKWHFTASADADQNLVAEGVDPGSIARVGSVAIDVLVRLLPLTEPRPLLEMFGLMRPWGARPFALVALRDPSTLEHEATMDLMLKALSTVASDLPVLFPVPPRARARMKDHLLQFSGLLLTEPLTYLQYLGLERHATLVVTDDGPVQEETTYLGVPCMTVRDSTERPITVHLGTNHLVGRDLACLALHVSNVLAGRGRRGAIPPLWDGHAAGRIADRIVGRC